MNMSILAMTVPDTPMTPEKWQALLAFAGVGVLWLVMMMFCLYALRGIIRFLSR